MKKITNIKILKSGAKPIWAPFDGFSLIFNNPGNSFIRVKDNIVKLNCSLESTNSLELYFIFWNFLQKIDIKSLHRNYTFCPLSKDNYHVTVWDGLNKETVINLNPSLEKEYNSFITSIPQLFLDDKKLFKDILSSQLITNQWYISFHFNKLALWNNKVLVAVLSPKDMDSKERFNYLKIERQKLTAKFDKTCEFSIKNAEFTPHVTLGYFSNDIYAKKINSYLPVWNGLLHDLSDKSSINFQNINLYAFTNMNNFYTKLNTGIEISHLQVSTYEKNDSNNNTPLHFPLIELLNNRFKLSQKKPLKNFLFIGIQHIQKSIVPLIHAVIDYGVVPNDTYLIGKAYSLNCEVFSYIQKMGCTVLTNNLMLNPAKSYEKEIEKSINSLFKEIIQKLQDNSDLSALIVDEGGKAITLLHKKYTEYCNRFYCVEQTTRGINEISKLNLLCPVINVARSTAKTEIEGPLIAKSMADGLEFRLSEWESVFKLNNKHVLIIGYGVVGRNLAADLFKRGFSVSIYENDPKVLDSIFDTYLIIEKSLIDAFRNTSIVIGCTGGKTKILKRHFEVMSDNTLIVNGASSDLEFESWKIREEAEIIFSSMNMTGSDLKYCPWNNLYLHKINKKRIFLANGGFPINFSFSSEPISFSKFQITRTLVLLGLIQSIKSYKGLQPLNYFMQNLLINAYKKLL